MPAAGGKFWNFGVKKSKEILQKCIGNTVETTENRFLEGGYRQKNSRLRRASTLPYIRLRFRKYVKKLY